MRLYCQGVSLNNRCSGSSNPPLPSSCPSFVHSVARQVAIGAVAPQRAGGIVAGSQTPLSPSTWKRRSFSLHAHRLLLCSRLTSAINAFKKPALQHTNISTLGQCLRMEAALECDRPAPRSWPRSLPRAVALTQSKSPGPFSCDDTQSTPEWPITV